MAKNILLFLGAPGAGKGTLAQRCCSELGYEQLSTGNLCREHIAQATDIGKEIDLALKSGKLVDDSLVTAMVTQWFTHYPQKQRIILDGYPRTVFQADAFAGFIAQDQETRPMVVHLVINEQTVIDRLSMRLICSKSGCQAVYSLTESGRRPKQPEICDYCSSGLVRRPDDEIDAIKKRLKLYSANEAALLDCYRRLGYEIAAIDAASSVEQVFSDLRSTLDVR